MSASAEARTPAPPHADALSERRFIRPFRTIANADVAIVGGKNASLGEMYRDLAASGVRVPNGFAVTADAYRFVLDAAGAWQRLHAILDGLDAADVADLGDRAARAHALVVALPVPEALRGEIVAAYAELCAQYGPGVSVAVRSSATAEDLPSASFAGQHETFLNVRGEANVLEAYRRCLASLFLERAIHYRVDNGFDHFKVALSVGVMKMVRSDLAASGVAFTIDTETGFPDVVLITGSYGLGESVVQGSVDPDEFMVHKPTYEQGFRAVLSRRLGEKQSKLVYGGDDTLEAATRNVPTPPGDRGLPCLRDEDVLELAGACIAIERHYGVPMDVEWAKDGVDGSIFIVQARPETGAAQRRAVRAVTYRIAAPPAPLVTGRAVGTAVAAGSVRVVRDAAGLAAFRAGQILVAPTTTPDWEPVMKIASAIVTDRGGRTCHAAIVARELGIPAVVGAGNATAKLHDGDDATVSCAEGDVGRVYPGRIPYERTELDAATIPRPPVKITLILADPDAAFELSALPNDGVGLVRIEFIVSSAIGIHPMALAHPERVDDPAVRAQIAGRTAAFGSPSEFFVRTLADGVGRIAAAFYPKPVIVRMSDFKTNEYARLAGGAPFEPTEDNPMLGFRGAARYAHPAYADGFALECAAMRRVRDTVGLRNVVLMIPFCRRVEEGERVVARMAELGLRRGENGLQIYVMCEIPNNVVQIDAFSRVFDGFSIGSNDLAQLVLGVDRDSELVAFDFDERDPGVLETLRQAIAGAKRNARPIGICGQAPSDYPEVAAFLIRHGIDSLGLDPDSVVETMRRLAGAR
ncbi:MAG TPA: phosphoenolpyruvate synthase [Candidatus Baltobacteraceae bacterium]|nr:phosphoenolpyruvate synthase [Candidatus Baltobacteraceae bacterium]